MNMGSRPIRQYYDRAPDVVIDDDFGPDFDTWHRHRERFVAAVSALDEDQWKATTRCTEWDAKDVLCHLITADMFWVVSLGAAIGDTPPTRYLETFDPSTTPGQLIGPMREQSYEAV